ncbi:MAG: MFS transporter [Streptosporangiaceae bacterium]|jgi:MFS family permease
MHNHKLGRDFGWLWTAFATSMFGSALAINAYSYIAIRVLHSGATQVALLSAAGLAVGGLLAVPLGPWVEFRRKRPVMIAMDLIRFTAQLSLPVAYALGVLRFGQLLVASVVVSAGNVLFKAASGANLKSLVRPEDLLVANARFESTTWTSTVLGQALSGVAIGIFGPLTTVAADSASYLLSAFGIGAIRGREPAPGPGKPFSTAEVMDGWRYILGHRRLRRFFFNDTAVRSLIMASAPVLSVLMLDDLRFTAWAFGLAFGIPCIGGLIGSRLSRRLVARYGNRAVLLAAGTVRACWPIGLAFIGSGLPGLAEVIVIELGLIISLSVFNPPFATYRLEQTPKDRVSRVLSAWSITSNLTIALLTVAWGVLAEVAGPRVALGVAGALMLCTPVLLPRDRDPEAETSVAPAARIGIG